MPRAVRLLLVPLAVVALLSSPVVAEEQAAASCVDPLTNQLVLTEQATWLHQAETKAGNVAALGATSFPSWNTTKPTASVQSGAGGGYLATMVGPTADQAEYREETGLTVKGTFSGCLDTMLFDLYAFRPTNRTGKSGDLAESPLTANVTLTVDGQRIVDFMQIEAHQVANPGGQATYLNRIAVTNLHAALVDFQLDPAAEHTITATFDPQFANTDHSVFVYDTSEVPAGITFNGVPNENYAVLAAF